MNQIAIFGTFTAVIVGLAVGFQGILSARLSLADNAVSTSIMVFLAGGIVAAIVLSITYPTGTMTLAPLTLSRTILFIICSLAGVVIVTGSAFAFANISPAVAVALIIFGQMALALAADTFGWTGQPPQEIDLRRVGGLAMLAGAIWLLIPRPEV